MSQLHPATASRIVRAVRSSNLAMDRVRKHRRALADALTRGDRAAFLRAERLLARAERDYYSAQDAMKFPWEVQGI